MGAWLIYRRVNETGVGEYTPEIIWPTPRSASVHSRYAEPRHFGDSLEQVIRALRPGNGYRYDCYEVSDVMQVAEASWPPQPPLEVTIS